MRISRPAAAALALLAPLAFTTTATAEESTVDAVARPAFEMPFPCGQIWRAGTRSNHKPLYAIDFNMGSGDSDKDKPVIASAGGTVDVRYAASGYVVINHGGGWTTYYAHLGSVAVKDVQKVARGARVGTVGKSGGQTYTHLHYEQRLNDNDVKAILHGKAVTYYGDISTKSYNC
ncbi:M23 family metallopeptidase [Lentzea sp. NEAU-D13]|uniref:M23 family metallopeptidase n=1 Tax=Lentzea alba TaxID=2714351 RepID=A0A7C9VXE5_9PSEU|nr:M23 family metallopeptidase [Lentzea alba]NGY65552.1 M23 family metallopeptidase [Lentzea alba]